ncbi:hypothetical protein N8508_00220 [bacterium]|nr:hypothetical protein [bacterium]
MKIILNETEVKEMVHCALCNGGLRGLSECGIILQRSDKFLEDYRAAKTELHSTAKKVVCYEDVLVHILTRGDSLLFLNQEEDSEISFDLEQVTYNLQEERCVPLIQAVISEKDDAYTAFAILQHALFGEEIYG